MNSTMNKMLLFFCLILAGFMAKAQKPELVNGLYYKNSMLYTGTYEEHHPNGRLLIVQQIRNGQEHGNVDLYYAGGTPQEHREFNNGMKTGVWLKWNEAGILVAEAGYQNNLKHGTWIIRNDKGVKLYEMHYTEGRKSGIWQQWNELGEPVMERNYDTVSNPPVANPEP